MKNMVLVIVFLLSLQVLSGQSLSVFDIDASNFPTIKAKFYAFAQDGKQISNLNPSDFEVMENGQQRIVTNVSCPAPQPPVALSSVLVFDVSGSMSAGPPRIQSAKDAANAWIDGLPLGQSECALVSFNDYGNIVQDFTTSRDKLKVAINKLTPGGGTNYDQALIDLPSGGLQIAKNGKFKKVVIFLTDGLPNNPPNVNDIIKFANDNQITIYAVTLDMPAPQSIKDMTEQTGGQYFENITTKKEAEDTYRQLLQTAQGGEPCEIEWESGAICISGLTNVEIGITNLGVNGKTSYLSPITSVAKLEFNPSSVKFYSPEIGLKVEEMVTVTARNSDFTVTNITSNNSAFTITPSSFVLNKGESIELTVSYLPADSGYNYCRFDIENDICLTRYSSSGGWKGKMPTIRTIKIIHPNGGEVFVAGSDTIITWEGIPPEELVKLEYTTNNGISWNTIASNVSGLSYNWRVPISPSDECLARVIAKDPISSNCYNNDVEICGKIWMACNLDVEHYRNGDLIRHAQTKEEWLDAIDKREGAWCYYDNDPYNGYIYGKLYNWFAVIDTRGLSPVGWHIPSDTEWTFLANCLGGSIAGGKLKESGTIEGGDGLWYSPNIDATNETKFSALPGGTRGYRVDFHLLGYIGRWWAASKSGPAYYRSLGYNFTVFGRGYDDMRSGFSVRCVRD